MSRTSDQVPAAVRVSHLGHACLLIEAGDVRVLVDPGTLAGRFDDVRGLDAILVTHDHADHLDVDRAGALLAANPGARLVILPRTPNIGFFFLEAGLLVPGDALEPTDLDVRVLALPVSGPWLRLEDSVDFLRALAPAVAFPMHEAALTEPEVWYDLIRSLTPETVEFCVLEPAVPTEL